MDEVTRQWLTTGVYFLTFIAAIVIETFWLIRRGWATAGRATAYVLLTDILSLGISAGASMTFALLLLMLVFGSSGEGTTGNDGVMSLVLVVAVIFPPVVFILTKRIFLAFLKFAVGRTAWTYSVAVTLVLLVLCPLPAIGFYYLLGLLR